MYFCSESNTKDSPPSKLKTLAEDDGEEGESSEKPLTCFYGELVYLTSSGETVVVPPSSTTTSSGLSAPTNKNEQEDKQLSQLMEAILSTGDKVAATVAELQAEPSSPLGLSQSLTLEGDTSSYVDAMRPLQFGKHKNAYSLKNARNKANGKPILQALHVSSRFVFIH